MPPMLEQRIEQHFIDSADLKYQAAQVLSKPIAAAVQAHRLLMQKRLNGPVLSTGGALLHWPFRFWCAANGCRCAS